MEKEREKPKEVWKGADRGKVATAAAQFVHGPARTDNKTH